jgi:hypothetical protein
MRRVLKHDGPLGLGLVWLAVALLLALAGTLRSAIPGVNEAHYLTKSRHFWDPTWCANDLFLQSTDAHWLFFQTVGALTRWLSFPAAAWVGRCLGWGLLAWGFCELAQPLLQSRRLTVSAALLWSAFAAPQGFSGEWLIGGIEAKVLAWGLALAGLGAWLQGAGRQAALRLGLATALHPVVGGWASLAWWLALPLDRWGPAWLSGTSTPVTNPPDANPPDSEETTVSGRQRNVVHWAHPLLLAFCALPGLLPVWQMLQAVDSPQMQRAATRIQVYERLPHHLLPQAFAWDRVAWSGFLLALCLLGGWRLAQGAPWRSLRCLLLMACLGTLAGGVASLFPAGIELLRFYPFRLLDGLLPVLAALHLTARWAAATAQSPRPRWAATRWAPLGLVVAACGLLAWPQPDRVQPPWKPDNFAAWRDVCDWVSRELPPEALCLTPKYSVGFKWWAQRAEFVTWKDCPQDAANLLEWKDRLRLVADWREKNFSPGFGVKALFDLRQYGAIDYVIAWNDDPFQVDPLYRNGAFSVYAIPGTSRPGPANRQGLPTPPPVAP